MRRALAMALLVTASCGDDGDDDASYQPEPFAPTAATRAYCGGSEAEADAVEARITTLLGQLSLHEKIALMQGADFAVVDGVWLVPGNERLGIPGLRMLDGPRGVSKESGLNATAFPVAMLRGATWSPALEAQVGAAMARELRSVGANVLLAPTMNILRHPRWGRAQETYGEDTWHMGALAVAFVQGVQGEGLLASAKHYAANSIEDTRYEVDVRLDERTLREIYLPHFERVVREARVASVMSAYNRVNGYHSDQQAHLLGDILKGEWQFAGFVESDWIAGTHGDAVSVLAGLDIEMPYGGLHFDNLEAAVKRGDLGERDIDRSVRRILRAQFCYGLDETTPVRDTDPGARETAAHLALARDVARRGMVLVRNQGPVLPIDAAAVQSIVIMGRNADVEQIGDSGSSSVIPSSVVTALEGMNERAAGGGFTVTHIAGTTLTPADEATVQAADVVIVVTGLQRDEEGEATVGAGDRATLAVPDGDVALIHALAAIHPAVVVVLEGGAAFTTADWDGEVEALLYAFYPGAEGGRALADVLLGDVAPAGRLPFSVPASEADLPPFDNVSHSVTYGYFHGYRHLAREGTPARYPFGSGLTYTTFVYSDLALDAATVAPDGTLGVEVTVENTGAREATETVQLYVRAVGSRVERAPRDLRGFAQVTLAPGASERVRIEVRARDLAFWDDAASAWEIEAIDYEAHVARHAEDPGLVATFRVE